jgi:murein DD-endopeptidase MepM/ murein hydrolase activator NlpD
LKSGFIKKLAAIFWAWWRKKTADFLRFGRHTWTIMWIPHSEKESKSAHVTNFFLIGVLSVVVLATVIGTVYFIDFTVKFKELLRLQRFKDIHQVNRLAFEKELSFYIAQTKPFRKELAGLSEKVPGDGMKLSSIGGRDMSLNESKALGLENFGAQLSNGYFPALDDNVLFFKDSAELMKQLEKFVSKRGTFFSLFPTLYPVEKGLGFIYKKPGDGNFLRISLLPGTQVLASGEATVSSIERDERGRIGIRLDHGFGIFTDYRGLSRAVAYKGDRVKKGELIGLSGNELFYVVQIADMWVDPLTISSIKEAASDVQANSELPQ